MRKSCFKKNNRDEKSRRQTSFLMKQNFVQFDQMIRNRFLAKKTRPINPSEMDVEQQTELMHQENTIWTAAYRADHETINQLIAENPDVIYTRGAVGECPIHVLFLCGSEEHLTIARDLLERYPNLVTLIYNKHVRLPVSHY